MTKLHFQRCMRIHLFLTRQYLFCFGGRTKSDSSIYQWPEMPNHHLNWRYSVTNHRQIDWLFNNVLKRTKKETSKRVITALYEGNPRVTHGLTSQRASNAEIVPMTLHHHALPNLHFHDQLLCPCRWYGGDVRPAHGRRQSTHAGTNEWPPLQGVTGCVPHHRQHGRCQRALER